MWKEYAIEIKKNMFLHADNTDTICHPYIIRLGLKTRPNDENGVLKTNKVYQLKLGDIKPIIENWVKTNKKDRVCTDDLPEILDTKDRMVFFCNDEKATYTIYNNGYSTWHASGWNTEWLNDNDYLVFALFNDMKELPKNAKEQAILKAKELSQRKVNLNNLILKDNLIRAFRKAGFELTTYDAGKTYRIDPQDNYERGTNYNDFIETAIDFYVNHCIAKELGCKIPICKVPHKNGHREPWDDLIDMEHIDIEGECDGCQEA